MRKYLLCFCLIVCFTGCDKSGLMAPKEPQGKTVTLTQQELNVRFIKESRRKWYAWHTTGIRLMAQARYEEALYCFHQALKAWPKKPDKSEEKSSRYQNVVKFRPEATDTIMSLGTLYMKMKRPELAKYYFEKFKKYFPYDTTIDSKIEEARKAAEKK